LRLKGAKALSELWKAFSRSATEKLGPVPTGHGLPGSAPPPRLQLLGDGRQRRLTCPLDLRNYCPCGGVGLGRLFAPGRTGAGCRLDAAGCPELPAFALGCSKGRLCPLADEGAFLLGKADLDTILTPSRSLADYINVRP
jgi:hypothetical protein